MSDDKKNAPPNQKKFKLTYKWKRKVMETDSESSDDDQSCLPKKVVAIAATAAPNPSSLSSSNAMLTPTSDLPVVITIDSEDEDDPTSPVMEGLNLTKPSSDKKLVTDQQPSQQAETKITPKRTRPIRFIVSQPEPHMLLPNPLSKRTTSSTSKSGASGRKVAAVSTNANPSPIITLDSSSDDEVVILAPPTSTLTKSAEQKKQSSGSILDLSSNLTRIHPKGRGATLTTPLPPQQHQPQQQKEGKKDDKKGQSDLQQPILTGCSAQDLTTKSKHVNPNIKQKEQDPTESPHSPVSRPESVSGSDEDDGSDATEKIETESDEENERDKDEEDNNRVSATSPPPFENTLCSLTSSPYHNIYPKENPDPSM